MRFEIVRDLFRLDTTMKSKVDTVVCVRWFDHLAEYCQEYNNLIPVAFILGFYVSIVVSRFWGQLNALPWPHRLAFFVAAMIHGNDVRGRVIRRTIMRYLTVSYILTMRSICPPVKKRFPKLQHIRDKGTAGSQAVELTDASVTRGAFPLSSLFAILRKLQTEI